MKGIVKVGLDTQQLEALSKPGDKVKVSRRDFPYVISQKLNGGTTVSGTMVIAHKVKIPVFVTGKQKEWINIILGVWLLNIWLKMNFLKRWNWWST